MDFDRTLRALCMLPAPSGYEDAAGAFLKKEFSRHTDRVLTDEAGNLTAVFAPSGPPTAAVMVFAHMDQLGLVVKSVDPRGYLSVDRLGGVPERILPGLEVMVRARNGRWRPGVVCGKPYHTMTQEERRQVQPMRDVRLDLGLASREEAAAAGVTAGCPVCYRPRYGRLANGLRYGTSLDNRGGCAVLLDLAERLSGEREGALVYLTATVQEEYNLRGAMLAAQELKPDFALALDVALTGDVPGMAGEFQVALGGGPVVSLYNYHGRGTLNGVIPHPRLVELAEQAARERAVPLQYFASTGILTDAAYVQTANGGTPVLDLGFPCRYTHTAVETCCLADLEELARLIEGMLAETKERPDFRRAY